MTSFFPTEWQPLSDQEEQQQQQYTVYESLSQTVEKVELLSQAPLVNNYKALSVNVIEPCPGYHQFRVWVPNSGELADVQLTTTTYHLIESSSSSLCSTVPQVCVPRCRAWPIAFAFRPSVTPLDWWLRITPVFTDGERTGDVVEKCRKHQTKSPGVATLQDLSFIEVVGSFAKYTKDGPLSACPKDQISVCFRLDVVELLRHSRVENTDRDLSQDQGSQSILLPEVRKTILCLIHCYNSCLGIGLKGETDLVITLEALRSDTPFQPEHEILGLQKVRVRCCACPSRDAKGVRELRHRPSDSTVVSGQTSVHPARKTPRCLSLTIPSRRNIRTRSNESQMNMDSPDLPAAEVTIKARKYYVLLTDDPLDYSRLRESRNLRSHSSERWAGRGTRPDIRQIDRAYTQRELHVARRFAIGVATHPENNSLNDSATATRNKQQHENSLESESEDSVLSTMTTSYL